MLNIVSTVESKNFVKIPFLLFFVFNVYLSSYSQKYRHGLGIGYKLMDFNLEYSSPLNGFENQSVRIDPYGALYKASLGFDLKEELLFSITAYPFLGMSLSGVYFNQTGNDYLIAEIPILAEISIGYPDEFCFIAGIGINSNYVRNFVSPEQLFLFGPQIGIGGIFPAGASQSLGLKLSGSYGLNQFNVDTPNAIIHKNQRYMISLGLFYQFIRYD